MRGKARSYTSKKTGEGITPAYAGKRRRKSELPETLQDHPRLCGEKLRWRMDDQLRIGSPPPMRGKGCQVNFCFNFHRITPAYAGKSASTFPTALTAEDHPRLCGEKLRMPASQMTVRGSPPPMRGKGHQQRRLADCEGITPAYAGKSCVCRQAK